MEHYRSKFPQHIVVLGANGGIGNQVVLQALEAGHKVTAILRTPSKLTLAHPDLTIVQGDVMQPLTLDQHFRGKDVIVSAIGKLCEEDNPLLAGQQPCDGSYGKNRG